MFARARAEVLRVAGTPPDAACHTARVDMVEPSLAVPLGSPTRPLWRGRLHQWGLFVAIPAMAALIALAEGTTARVAVSVYAVGLCAMLATSTTYHRWVHGHRARQLLQRADHATIYAAIAGTFTPMCLLALPSAVGVPLLVVVWTAGVAGAVLKFVAWNRARVIGGVLYIAVGWLGLAGLPFIWWREGWLAAALVVVGGAAYTVGAVLFFAQRPRLRPTVFSYHEVWHAFTLVAAAAQFGAIWLIAT